MFGALLFFFFPLFFPLFFSFPQFRKATTPPNYIVITADTLFPLLRLLSHWVLAREGFFNEVSRFCK